MKGAALGAASSYGQARSDGLSRTASVMKGAGGAAIGVKNALSPLSRHYGQLADKAALNGVSAAKSVSEGASSAGVPSTAATAVQPPSSANRTASVDELPVSAKASMPEAGEAGVSPPLPSGSDAPAGDTPASPGLGSWIQKKAP